MNRYRLQIIWFGVIGSLLGVGCFAAPAENGVSGEITLWAGYTSSDSNFNVDSPLKSGDLNGGGESNDDVLFFPLGSIRYVYGAKNLHELFAQTSRADIVQGTVALEVGYKHWLKERSYVSVSALPTMIKSDTWSDPFVTGQNRQETQQSGTAYRFQFEDILGLGLSADFGYYETNLGQERSGLTDYGSDARELRREGDGLYSKLSWTVYAGPGRFIQPSIIRDVYSADGGALSNTQQGISLTYIQRSSQRFLAMSVNFEAREFDQIHPIFNLRQHDDKVGLSLIYQHDNLFGKENIAGNLIVSYSKLDSNIDFYAENSLFCGIGVTLKL